MNCLYSRGLISTLRVDRGERWTILHNSRINIVLSDLREETHELRGSTEELSENQKYELFSTIHDLLVHL